MAQKRKKTPEKKTKQSRQKRKAYLSPAKVRNFRQALLDKYREIVGDVNSMENEALKKSRLDASGDLSSMPIHMADIGTDNYEQEFALGLLDSERKLLQEIADALRRIEEGTYGFCEATGKPIAKARLEATPWARYCIEYARMLEQGLVKEEEPAPPPPEEEEEKSKEEISEIEDFEKGESDQEKQEEKKEE